MAPTKLEGYGTLNQDESHVRGRNASILSVRLASGATLRIRVPDVLVEKILERAPAAFGFRYVELASDGLADAAMVELIPAAPPPGTCGAN